MMDEEIRQALCEVREMKKMCGNINMKLTNIVTQRGQDIQKKLDAEYQRGFENGKAVHDKGCEGCKYEGGTAERNPCFSCSNYYQNYWAAKDDKIVVGDEVTDIQSGANFLVTHLWESNHGDKGVSGFNRECSAFQSTIDKVKKTGRHFDIASILEAMKV